VSDDEDRRFADSERWLERHDLEFEGHRKFLAEHDERLDELESHQRVLEAGIAIARWLIAILIPVAAVLVAVWRG